MKTKNSESKKARLILEQWSTDLASKDRSMKSVTANFDELFHELWRASISFDIVHELINDAIAEHLPSSFVAKLTYKNIKQHLKDKTFNEFLNDWKKSIKDKAYQSFYSFYSLEDGPEEVKKKEAKYGSMSAMEYAKQRKYADSFPTIVTDELQRRLDEIDKMDEHDLEVTFEEDDD